MAQIVVTEQAARDPDLLIEFLTLPESTGDRVRNRLVLLSRAPAAGKSLGPPFGAARWIVGPWKWMVIVYVFDASDDRVDVVAFQDGRSHAAASHMAD